MSAPAPFSVRDLTALRRVVAVAAHPSGQSAVATVERLDADGARYVSDLWRLDLAGGAPPRRLTRGDHRDRAPAFDDDGTLYFLSDRPTGAGGKDDERRSQVWALPDGGGEPVAVTDEPHGVSELRVRGGRLVVLASWLPGVPAGEQREARARQKKHGPTALHYRGMPVRFWDAWLGPTEPRLVAFALGAEVGPAPADGRVELTAHGEGIATALREASWDLSPDGATVALAWATMSPVDRIEDRSIAFIDTHTGARRVACAEPGLVHHAPRFSPDGRALAVTRYRRTSDGYGARSLWLVDVASGEARPLTHAWDRWPVAVGFAADGARVIATAEDEGAVPLFAIDVDGRAAPRRLGPARGSWGDVALVPGRAVAVGVRSSLLSPPEVFALALDAGADAGPRALGALSGATFAADLPMPTVREVRFDVGQREVPAFVVEPPASAGGLPADKTVLWIHGGPVSAWTDSWHWRWSSLLMAAHGFRVVLPNPAGSTGYGIAWVNDIWGNTWGGRCYDDLMGVVDALEREGVRAADMVAMGGSFGGYMTNWIGGHTDRFRLLVTHASVFRMSSFHLATDVPAWWELMMGGHMWSDADFDRYAPSHFVGAWRTPTLVLHGDKDYRVPVTESLSLFEALQRHGVASELVVFPDEHHWILRPRNIIAWYDAVLDFIARRWGEGGPDASRTP